MERIRIIIADDHKLFADGLRSLLEEEKMIEIIDVVNSAEELLGIVRTTKADLILLDINMPKMNGLDALRFIKQSHPEVKVAILSTYFDDHLVDKAKVLGASGYMLKTIDKTDFINAIHSIANEETYFANSLKKKNLDNFEFDNFSKQFSLTKREFEIISYIKKGSTNEQIANTLHLSIYTIETHRKNIMQKLKL